MSSVCPVCHLDNTHAADCLAIAAIADAVQEFANWKNTLAADTPTDDPDPATEGTA